MVELTTDMGVAMGGKGGMVGDTVTLDKNQKSGTLMFWLKLTFYGVGVATDQGKDTWFLEGVHEIVALEF